jgi:hypothetical protein
MILEFISVYIMEVNMDVFIERLVKKKKDTNDILLTIAVWVGGILLAFILLTLSGKLRFIGPFLIFIYAGIAYGGYILISGINLEYEYSVTNGDLDIDKIMARRRRKRIFSANIKEFDIIAKVKSEKFTDEYRNIANKIKAVSSMDSADLYFACVQYKGNKTVLYFEPDEKMLNAFKTSIPRKLFI